MLELQNEEKSNFQAVKLWQQRQLMLDLWQLWLIQNWSSFLHNHLQIYVR